MQHKKKAPVTAATVYESTTKYNTVIVTQYEEDVKWMEPNDRWILVGNGNLPKLWTDL